MEYRAALKWSAELIAITVSCESEVARRSKLQVAKVRRGDTGNTGDTPPLKTAALCSTQCHPQQDLAIRKKGPWGCPENSSEAILIDDRHRKWTVLERSTALARGRTKTG